MLPFHLRPVLLLAAGGVVLASAPGCAVPIRAYAPSHASARDSLDAALTAWQKGAKPEGLDTISPRVHVVDHQWQAGQALLSYEILDQKPGAGVAERRFDVRLNLKKPLGEKQVEYIIIGRDPLWIFRDDDYVKTGNMGDDPKPARVARRR